MRLLFCCNLYHPSRGGVQEVMRQIAERMARLGHDVTVATGYLADRDFDVLNGVRVRQFKVSGNLVAGIKGEADRYRDFVAGFGADAILIKAAQQWTFDALWAALDRLRARKVFVPCGFSLLYHPDFAGYYRQMPEVLRKFDHLIFYAEKYRDTDFARAHGCCNFSIVPNAASEAEFDESFDCGVRARLGVSEEDFVFLSVGSPILGKGHGEIAEAFARLDTRGRPAALILNGSWPPPSRSRLPRVEWAGIGLRTVRRAGRMALRHAYRAMRSLREGWPGMQLRGAAVGQPRHSLSQVEQWVARANAQSCKRVLQLDLPRPELVNAFKTADLFVFASNVEYSPLVLFEAAAAGTPFLSVPVGNAEEIARWTGAGWICPAPRDPYGFTRAEPSVLAREMERSMTDPDGLARLAATGRARWRERFTWKDIVLQYEAILAGREVDNGIRSGRPEPIVL
jgi:glycosyltransferase involved in cell wall biosynthesis